MFVNYFRNRRLDSPINLAAARVLLGTYLVWNVASFDWGAVAEWNVPRNEAYLFLVPPADHLVLPAEKWLLVATLLGFTLGYRLGATSFVSAVLLSHLAGIMHMYSPVGRADAMFTSAYLLLFFGIYRSTDVLTADAMLGRTTSTAELRDRIETASDRSFSGIALTLSLLAIALLYFGSAVYKVRVGPLFEWTTAWNLGRLSILVQEELGYTFLGRLFLEYPVTLWGSAWGTVFLEAGFLPVVLLGVSITPIVLGLFGTHTIIVLALGPFFFDQYVFLLLFLSWDRVHDWLALDRRLDVVYDDRCSFCTRVVYPFALVDTRGVLGVYSQRDVPARYANRDDVRPTSSVYVFGGDKAYAGYDAIRELTRQYGELRPVTWALDRDPVERVGRRLYARLARHRADHVTGEETDEQTEPVNR